MYRRVIPLQVSDEYVRGDGVPVGAAGSHDDVALRLTFGTMWAGTARSIVWYDANGENPTITALTTDMLAEGESEVYLVPIPAAPKAVAGQMLMTIKGATVSGSLEDTATLTTTARFTVMESDWSGSAEEAGDITATQAEQFQAEIENIKTGIVEAKAAGAAAAQSEQKAAESQAAAASSATQAAESEAAAAASVTQAQAAQTKAETAQTQAESARTSAQTAQNKAESAQAAAETARAGAETAQAAAETAQAAAQAKANAAQQSADSAANCASEALSAVTAAEEHANEATAGAGWAKVYKENAEASQTAAAASAKTAESWAVGGTGTRSGEDTDNAKYWAKQAEAVVGGDFATKAEAQGYVTSHNEDSEAHSDLREAIAGKETAGAAAAVQSNLDSHTANKSNPHGVTASQIGAAASSHTHATVDITGLDTALAGKAASSHTHTVSQISDFPSSMPASDVYSWAKQASKPTYTASEVGAAASSHTHTVSQITGTLPVSKGGTGQTSLSALMTAMGAGKIVTGKYTGDGNASMTINLGFTPKAVLLYARDRNSLFDSYYGTNPSNTDDNKSTLCLQGETIVCEANNVVSVSGNSFTVYYLSNSNKYGTSVFIYANASGKTFNYIAFG